MQVCPTGIDIRDGLQYQCIHCALCVDACDTIMDKQGWPRGLIRYTSERELEGGKTHPIRLKTVGYGAVMLVILGALVASILDRPPMDANVNQVRQPLYVQMSDGQIQNSYEIRLNNTSQEVLDFDLGIDGLDGATLDLGQVSDIRLEPGERLTVLARVRYDVPADASGSRIPFDFVITDRQGRIDPYTIGSQFSYAR